MLRSSHKNRIAKGSGTSVREVNKLLNNFDRMQRVMKQMRGGFRF
jgi:signal recognition particle subunit SRP54